MRQRSQDDRWIASRVEHASRHMYISTCGRCAPLPFVCGNLCENYGVGVDSGTRHIATRSKMNIPPSTNHVSVNEGISSVGFAPLLIIPLDYVHLFTLNDAGSATALSVVSRGLATRIGRRYALFSPPKDVYANDPKVYYVAKMDKWFLTAQM